MNILCYRLGRLLRAVHLTVLARALDLTARVATGATVPSSCAIGEGTTIAYGGSGVVIHPRARIGRDCLISPGVVIGGRGRHTDVPQIANHVKLYPGAKVLGPVTVGDRCVVGPNAVVVDSLPPDTTVVAPKALRLEDLR